MHTVHNEFLQERLKFKPISNVNNGRYGLSKRLAAECFAFELHILLANLILQRKNTSVVSTQFRLLISAHLSRIDGMWKNTKLCMNIKSSFAYVVSLEEGHFLRS